MDAFDQCTSSVVSDGFLLELNINDLSQHFVATDRQQTGVQSGTSTALVEGKLSKNLKKILKKIVAKDAHEQLAVADAKLGGVIKDKLNLSCIHSPMVTELMRGIRSQIEGLITGLPSREMAAMCLGLAHSLSRYKLKFSPDKVDTMIVQAISLLDDLDKELNNYIMRCREWYGWHFPELGKIITDNLTYCKCVRKVGDRRNFASSDVADILSEEIEEDVKAAAEISMGTEVSEEDINNIIHLCDQVIEISEYRTQLYDYLKNRMMAIAPNLTVMVGELVGARLIAHAGSLLNLAKHPASTVQILGAEKALFRALKTKRDTPKFGLIYHASLVGQTTAKNKGKISRMLAAKTALTIRYDALGEDTSAEMGAENRLKVETRLRHLEERGIRRISGTGKALARADKYQNKSEVKIYDPSGDSTLPVASKKRKIQEVEEQEAGVAVKAKKVKREIKEETSVEEGEPVKKKKKKKEKKKQTEDEGALTEEPPTSPTVESFQRSLLFRFQTVRGERWLAPRGWLCCRGVARAPSYVAAWSSCPPGPAASKRHRHQFNCVSLWAVKKTKRCELLNKALELATLTPTFEQLLLAGAKTAQKSLTCFSNL
ncbi:nucleolar protein 58 isoform X2 [Apteryx mantelli]|uniref:Nucleolar protein 58 isoform X2 n=1 Tax=Apteryx mantelli TaxID=2696672 RepID=A0ABM4EQG4_9AVES